MRLEYLIVYTLRVKNKRWLKLMVTLVILIALGVLTQVVVLATSRDTTPRFTPPCSTCGYQMPPTEYGIATEKCPNCERLINLGVDLSDWGSK